MRLPIIASRPIVAFLSMLYRNNATNNHCCQETLQKRFYGSQVEHSKRMDFRGRSLPTVPSGSTNAPRVHHVCMAQLVSGSLRKAKVARFVKAMDSVIVRIATAVVFRACQPSC